MKYVVDTSVVIAVITNEKHKRQLIQLTKGAELISPYSLYWEIGNAFSAMFKRKRTTLDQVKKAIALFNKINIRYFDINLNEALEVSEKLDIYAYDAYFLVCSRNLRAPLLTIDSKLVKHALNYGISVVEVE
ncbi:type II toxin-antitoxin system VapC family toxin [bacterium]|nr:type II toxin-antitoxin system VapC family toxin [bacterium]